MSAFLAAKSAVRGLLLLSVTGALLCLRAPASGDPDVAEINRLIRRLGSDQFAERQDAAKRLLAVGEPAVAPLRQAAASSDDIEVRRRAADLAQEIVRTVYAPLRTFAGHTDQATYAVFSPGGKRILSTSHDHTLRLWPLPK
jgi:hypothetical protein